MMNQNNAFGYQQPNPANFNGYGYGNQNAFQNSYQQPVNISNRSFISGRIVFSPEQISPQEIPTDGNPAVFPLFDGSKIIVKCFREDGTYSESVYQLVEPPKPRSDQNNGYYEEISSRLKNMEDNVARIMNDLYSEKKGPVKENEQ